MSVAVRTGAHTSERRSLDRGLSHRTFNVRGTTAAIRQRMLQSTTTFDCPEQSDDIGSAYS